MVSPYKTDWDTYKRCRYYKRSMGRRSWFIDVGKMQYRLE